jgi:hypothetical protein
MKPKKVVVNDLMQKGYTYYLTEPIGKNFDLNFKPELTPKEMLHLGVFGGKYMSDCKKEFPASWTRGVKFSHEQHDPKLNYFKINASLTLKEWNDKGWIYYEDPRGWFQWYCRYFFGRRVSGYDEIQIKRWKAFSRHIGQIKKNCTKTDFSCRPKQRQALLHWAYDSRKL